MSAMELHGLDPETEVFFYEQDFYVLSNFSAFNVRRGSVTFQTAEHAYQWAKFVVVPGVKNDIRDTLYSVRSAIENASSAHDAFKIARLNEELCRHDWADARVGIMHNILGLKANQHEYVRRKLLATGDRVLIENSWRDDFWGWGPNRDGQNMLGKLWMRLRAELRGEGQEAGR